MVFYARLLLGLLFLWVFLFLKIPDKKKYNCYIITIKTRKIEGIIDFLQIKVRNYLSCKPYFRLSLPLQSLAGVRFVCTGRQCWIRARLHWPVLSRSTQSSAACTGRGSRCQMYLVKNVSRELSRNI